MNGADLIWVALGLLVLLGLERYTAWSEWDRYRRLTRKAHVNLMRGLR